MTNICIFVHRYERTKVEEMTFLNSSHVFESYNFGDNFLKKKSHF